MPAMPPRFNSTPFGSTRRMLLVGITALTSFAVLSTDIGAQHVSAAGVDSNDWLGVVNTYRSQSGLAPVSENPSWATGTTNHSCWMLLNGIAHDEAPGTAGYTADGDQAGNSGNVAVSSANTATARGHIDLWMSGPFHAIGILRPNLSQTSYGQCTSPPNPSATQWKSAGTLDVVRGNNWGAAKPATPVVFPGQGATTSLTRFVAESPDPRTYCNWAGRNVGLPLIALMPSAVSSATAVLTGPNGPVSTCVLTGSNTDGVASSILGGENAVVVVPDAPLVTGSYSVSVNSSGGAVNWSFNVDPNAPLAPTVVPQANTTPLGAAARFQSVTPFRFADSRVGQTITRLPAGQQVRIQVAGQQGIPADVTAISANFTVAESDGPGYLTAFNCSGSAPQVSTLNYRPGEAIANQAVVPLDRGALCVFAYTGAHLIIDVNGYVSASSASQFVPTDPKRLLDTRYSAPLQAGATLRVVVEGGASPAPLGSDAVALNLTMADTLGDGWIRAFPCDAAEPGVSSVNARAGGVRANSVIVPTAADGTICVTASVTTHVIVDLTGWFRASNGYSFVPLAPIRLADTRSFQPDLNPAANAQALQPGSVLRVPVAGIRGVPANAKAATVNLVALDAPVGGWLRVVPCGTSSDVSNLNYQDAAPVANGANVKLSADGAICLTTFQPAHVIVDVTGVWL
jgi:hypothetical protein